MSARQRVGALVYDWPRFLRHIGGDWTLIRNRDERITSDGRGVRCHWLYTSELHIANVYPSTSAWLERRARRQWSIELRDEPRSRDPEATFVIGHRGMQRLPHLLATLRSIAAQRDAAIECIVVEQSAAPEIEARLPSWVRYLHTPSDTLYNRSATFNAAARIARSDVLILHDNDMLVPAAYAAEAVARVREGATFLDLKRFVFYRDEEDTKRFFETGDLRATASTVIQNLRGGSIVAAKSAYDAIGGFDEEFVGWGGEDNDFWDRAETYGRVYDFGYLPIVHLWHAAQPGKGVDAPGSRRYAELMAIDPKERIARLQCRRNARSQ